MDLLDVRAVTSPADGKRCVHKRSRARHKRLHLRKTAVEPPTMQREDKSGPKKIAEEWERGLAWSSSKKSLQEAQQSHNTLRFACSQCREDTEYAPKDLVRHFEEKHKGSPPVFPCHTCTFTAQEFSLLQVHSLSHKDTFASCSICDDNVQRTWPEFSAHLTMRHCQKGKYLCEKCQSFSTSDAHVLLEHMCAHGVRLEGAGGDLSPHTKHGTQSAPKALRCQHCDYEASQKWLITRHVKAVHVCPNGSQRKQTKEVQSVAIKPNDPIPKMKPRLTRSAVREMCWLTQDCLSLPGREFLDKYCHLSDPQTTLEETQQFLKKSVARETSDQKWTKALKTVLSNVPQDLHLHPKSENGLTLNSDLTVLTVKNKITVAQNGASYSKRFKRVAPAEKAAALPEGGGAAAADACCVVDQNGCQPSLNEHALCAQAETNLHNDNVAFECAQMQENRENRESREEGKSQDPMDEGGSNGSSDPKLTNEYEEQPSGRKVQPRSRKSQRRKRNVKYKKVDKPSSVLKIVLKKNPVKGKQWVSKSSLSTSGDGSTGANLSDLPINEKTVEKMQTRASKNELPDPSAARSVSQLKPGIERGPSCAARSTGPKHKNGNDPLGLEGSLSTYQETQKCSNAKSDRSRTRAAAETGHDNVELHAEGSLEDHVSEEESSGTNGVTPLSSYWRPSPVTQPGITSQGESILEDLSLALPLEECKPTVEGIRDGELTVEPSSGIVSTCSTVGKAIQRDPSSAFRPGWQSVPKNQERTLKLVAINPAQPVKRPAGDQPVVVLNHPDADIPEVARIMEVVNRYKGEVQKVRLSRRTLKVLSAMNGEFPKAVALPDFGRHCENSVQERFILKIKLRRLSRKKYEVVDADYPCGGAAHKFRCWFCGRVFESQEVWIVHRQRHLME